VSKQGRLRIISIGMGVAYGLAVRGLIQIKTTAYWILPLVWVMSVAFVIVLPFSMGYLSIGMRAREGRVRVIERIFIPWIVVLLALVGCELVAWEGTICIAMIMPIALVFGTIGGLTAGAIVRPSQPYIGTASMAIVALLPFMIGSMEHRVAPNQNVRTVESEAIIYASPQTIWKNIERVSEINASELPQSWNRSIGFPRPIEATLNHEGIGGVRHASFAGKVLFIETIDEWLPEQRLGFYIHADTRSIPSSTLDEHVTVGGPYFDVLHGEYVLEPEGDGKTRLRLISQHRVSTDFNWYAGLWTDAVMRNVQSSILYVIKNRCENR
jgi:hypothetical protein